MLTPKLTGIFDCRKYDKSGKLQHDQRPMLADTENVTFFALVPIDAVPEVFFVNGALDEFARPRVSRQERKAAEAEGRQPVNDVVAVKFKISPTTRWFDKYAKACDRPTNEELEKSRWAVQLDFVRKEKDTTNPLKPSGYWANNIMVAKIDSNPFEGQAFEVEEHEPETEAAPAAPADDLPFA